MKLSEIVAIEPAPVTEQEYERPMVTDLGAWEVITLAQSVSLTGTALFDPSEQQW